uniref:Longchain fatty acid transporter putative n=1 Tax=Albugo laibachii Nc14 TaxID=890382 RepID=F0WLN8_9STRA|nr:longchain fatty acid transporter putative [Albugo laibachii Nc14]|eukprot:CCA22204.1 longchain fatty acid transporter putative [Albugo laibachii Nc14]
MKIGVVTAFINTEMETSTLLHAIRVIDPSILIVDDEILVRIHDSIAIPIHLFPSKSMETMPMTRPNRSIRSGIDISDTCLLLYSGDTNHPTRMTHRQSLSQPLRIHFSMQLNAFDRIFTCLPFHSAGLLPPILAILSGAPVILSSSDHIWTHIRLSKSTILHFADPLCRMLLDAPSTLQDAEHQLRAAFGIGLSHGIRSTF